MLFRSKGFGVEHLKNGIIASGAILQYLIMTQHTQIGHITSLARIEEDKYVRLDKFTVRSLELIGSMNDGGSSLLNVIDKTISPMGARLLKRWLVFPLKDVLPINERLNVVEYFFRQPDFKELIEEQLHLIGDLERIISKVAVGRVSPREVVALKVALQAIEPIKEAFTWKYPSCILTGDNSTAEFYSVAVTNNYQQADTGTKMIHLGKNTRSTIVSKGISAGHSENSYRGLVRVAEKADNARNYSQCDSLLLGDKCGAHTFPYMDIHNETAVVEHEATTSKISEDQIFYCNQRGIPTEDAIGLIVNGYAKEVLNKLPMEFAVEAQKLLTISLEGSVDRKSVV